MKRMMVAAALLAAAPAAAQSPDPLCATLDKALASAGDLIPFSALAPGLMPDISFVPVKPNPPGLEMAESCEGYLAGTAAHGTVGGGEHNKFECQLASGDRKSDSLALSKVQAARDGLASRVRACLELRGWTAAPLEKQTSGMTSRETYRFLKGGSETDVVVETLHEQRGRSASSANTYFTALLAVRVLNPNHPGYKKPE
jgi:hypothetical protein